MNSLPKGLLLCLLALSLPLQAGPRYSASYSILADSVDGGRGSSSASYGQFGSFGFIGASMDSAPYHMEGGYIPQITSTATTPFGGTVTLNPASPPYNPGAAVSVTFAGWTDPAPPLTYSVLIDDVVVSAQGATTARNIVAPIAPGPHVLRARIHNSLGLVTDVVRDLSVTSALQAWRQSYFGTYENTGNAVDTFDFDLDGVVNLIEFGFGLNPTSNASSQLPAGQVVGGNFQISFVQPAGVSGIVYGAEWSPSMEALTWISVPDSGAGNNHVFNVPIAGKAKVFVRLRVTGS